MTSFAASQHKPWSQTPCTVHRTPDTGHRPPAAGPNLTGHCVP